MMLGFSILIVAFFGVQIAVSGVPKKRFVHINFILLTILLLLIDQEYIPIKYPGPIQEVTNRRDTGEVPEECRNQNFCTIKPADYPQERFNEMFKGTKRPPRPTLIIENVADRLSDTDDDDNCRSTVAYEPIYKVWSKGKWHLVVQAPEENYVQAVRTEVCSKIGTPCFTALPPVLELETLCQQKYSSWQFLVATENNSTQKVKTDLPVCCSCRYKYKT